MGGEREAKVTMVNSNKVDRKQQAEIAAIERLRKERDARRRGVVYSLREEDYPMPTGKTWFWGDPDEDGGGA